MTDPRPQEPDAEARDSDCWHDHDPDCAELTALRAKLALAEAKLSQRDKLVGTLVAVLAPLEWSSFDGSEYSCPECSVWMGDGKHAEGCAMRAALQSAKDASE